MEQYFIFFIIFIIALLIGAFIGKLIANVSSEKEKSSLQERNAVLLETKATSEKTINQLQLEHRELQAKKEDIIRVNIQQDAAIKGLNEKLSTQKDDLENIQEKFTKEFENLANKVLEEKSTKFTEQNKENIKGILEPLQVKIKDFEKRVEDTNKESIRTSSALKQQLEELNKNNLKISQEAINLTKALKGDSKIQGDWGETQLEIILEKANLTNEIHYTKQGGYRDENGRLKKPDFIINLPDNRHLIIDSKVSLTNYEAYFSAENDNEKQNNLKKHIESIRKHIKDLGEKRYSDLYEINTPDYVLMFVPIESALMLAYNQFNKLYLEALDKNVVLVSTSTLLATLSTVSSMWRQENQKNNVLEIAKQAGRLYDQFVNLTDDLIKVGNQLKTVQGSYDSSMKKLTGKGNLITKVEKIKILGATTSKNLNTNLLDRANEED